MLEINKNISDLIQNDQLPFEPDPAIEIRLLNHLQLKAAYSKPRQNMIMPIFTGFLTSKLLELKIGVVAAIMIGFIGFKQLNNQSNKITVTDTCSVNLKGDSIGYLQVMDSTSFN